MLPQLAGIRQAKRLCMLGEMIPADEALHLGLFTAVSEIADLATRNSSRETLGSSLSRS